MTPPVSDARHTHLKTPALIQALHRGIPERHPTS